MMLHVKTAAVFVVGAVMTCACTAQEHGFSVHDSIEMVRFSDSSATLSGRVVHMSPDGKHIAVVTSRGIIKSNETESSLWTFDVKAIQHFLDSQEAGLPPRPRLIAKIAAVPEVISVVAYAPVISDITWSSDSQNIFFLGQSSQGEHRLYRAGLSSSGLHMLTHTGYDVLSYVIDKQFIVVKAVPSRRPAVASEYRYSTGTAVTGKRLVQILFPTLQESPKVPELWSVAADKFTRLSDPHADQAQSGISIENTWDDSLAVSPRRHLIVWLAPIDEIEPSWEGYRTAIGSEHMRLVQNDHSRVASSSLNRLQHYVITDARTGVTSSIIDAPMGRGLGYGTMIHTEWSRDGQHLLLTNTFLPLRHVDADERKKRENPCAVAVFEVESRDAECVVFTESDPNAGSLAGTVALRGASFGPTGEEVLIRTSRPGEVENTETYYRQNGKWMEQRRDASEDSLVKRIATPEEETSVRVAVKESLNNPPALWVTTLRTGRSKKLWDPNPQFKSMRFGETTVYHWTDKTGYEWTGGLVKPVDYVPGTRYPLVIQLYQFRQNEFMTDGMDPTAMAARPLASAGIFFLQASRKPLHTFDQKEADDNVEGMLSAIDHLTSDGLIDPSRVGLIGFSWTCWYVEHALIKAPGRFAAATIADGPDNSYMQYRMIGVGNPVEQETFERINGGKPIGEGLHNWIERAPSFHLDKVQTPLRIEAIRPVSILAEWEIYSSLWQQQKPVDLIYFPDGQHIFQKPLDRLTSQQGNVDWFRFWLQGYKNPTPRNPDQYERWEQMRSVLKTK
jgi:dipeptidyl aminopeptidase/acylaminoacyl peptidase